jgi:uncharacterized membrane protein YebE (DUF533 family)
MIDATRILDMLVGGNGSQGGAPAPYGQPQAQQQGGQQQGAGDLIERAKGMLGGVAGNLPSGLGGGVAGGIAAGAITSLLLGSKGGRELAAEALKLGAAAALGGLAYRAYSNYKSGQPVGADTSSASVPSVRPSPLPAATPANDHALLLVRAMIAAALSDGTLDETERDAIIGRLTAAGINADEQRFLETELTRPLSPRELATSAATPEQRAEVYLASALAIDADTEAERAYLKYLAATLALDDKLIAHLEDAVRGAKAPVEAPQLAAVKARAAG